MTIKNLKKKLTELGYEEKNNRYEINTKQGLFVFKFEDFSDINEGILISGLGYCRVKPSSIKENELMRRYATIL